MDHQTRKFIAILFSLITLVTGCVSQPVTQTSTATPQQSLTLGPQVLQTDVSIETTPLAEPAFADGDLALSFGDYETALDAYKQTNTADSDDLKAAALYGQALVYIKQENLFQAEPILENLIDSYPDTLPAKRAYFLLAQVKVQQDDPQSALGAWQKYLTERPSTLDAYVYEQIGDLYAELGQNEQALEAYTHAYLSPTLGDNLSVGQKVATAYETLGQPDQAVEIYRDLYFRTDDIYFEAQMDLLLGRALINQGETEKGYAYFQDAVTNYPETYDAYSALVALIEAEQSVDDLQRGLINYYVGQYDLAIEAFKRYQSSDGADKDKAMYYRALATRASGLAKAAFNSDERFNWNSQGGTNEDNAAITLWSDLVDTYPQSDYVAHSIEDIVYTQQAYMDNISLATETALFYVAQQPQASYAPGLLFTAGRYYEIQGKLDLAASTWDRIGTDYPSSSESFQGMFFAGILYYRMDNLVKASLSLNRALLLALEPLEIAGSYLWLGKVSQAEGDQEKAAQYWNSAVTSDPNGYYGIRAQELLDNKPIFAAPEQLELDVDMTKARQAAASWLRTSFNLPSQLNLDYSSELFNDPRFIRGNEYYKLGMFTEARNEFESLRNDNTGDPVNTFRLMQVFLDKGLYRSAIETSRTILKLTGYSDSSLASNLPDYFDYVQYGTYYLPWVKNASERYNVPILLLFSVIHQESHFDGFASSSAGAQGLMQLMPATGSQIASEINYPPNYTDKDLTVPFYNLTLGTNYLARQIFLFDGDYYASLAAYNGGPGSALDWKEISGDDPDLYLGSIRYLESRNYIRKIVEIYAQYSRIYGK
ncbi:MAG: tetratricopeptide repeat protein [Anaerolineaceae bacterium]